MHVQSYRSLARHRDYDPEMEEPETPSAEEFISRHKEDIASGRVRVKAKDILQTGTHLYQVEQATHKIQSNNPQKVLIIERLRWVRFAPKWEGAEPRREHEPDEISYRVGYRVVSRSGKWWWGSSRR
jgi:hypothetical protein